MSRSNKEQYFAYFVAEKATLGHGYFNQTPIGDVLATTKASTVRSGRSKGRRFIVDVSFIYPLKIEKA